MALEFLGRMEKRRAFETMQTVELAVKLEGRLFHFGHNKMKKGYIMPSLDKLSSSACRVFPFAAFEFRPSVFDSLKNFPGHVRGGSCLLGLTL